MKMLDIENKKRSLNLRYLVVGSAVLLFFGVENFLEGNFLVGILELAGFFCLVLNYVLFLLTKNLFRLSLVSSIVTFLMLNVMYVDGGLGGRTGVYWYFVFPVLVYFTLDKWLANFFLGLLSLSTFGLYLFGEAGHLFLPFNMVETRQLIFALLVEGILIANYQLSNREYEETIEKDRNDLDALRFAIEQKQKELETEKENLLKREAETRKAREAMLNLLEDERELETQIKQEKENVEKKVAERTAELKREKERLFEFLRSMPEGVFVLDKDGLPYFANDRALKMLGMDGSKVTQEDLVKFYCVYKSGTDERYPTELQPATLALKGKTVTVSDVELDNGIKRVPIRVTGAPVFDTNGNVEYGIVVFQDITEEIVLNRSKEEFFSIASHELRTPLTAIRGNASMLKEIYADKVADDDFAGMISDIYLSSVRLIDLVNEFLDMGRLEQGRVEFKKELFDVSEGVEGVMQQMSAILGEKSSKIKMLNSCRRAMVVADKNRLSMVLTNLIANSLKFTESGEIEVKSKVDHNNLYLYVRDTGCGISQANKTLLFRKFQQAGESLYTRDTSKGTGLGLYVSRLMIEGMGGKIWLEDSEVGKGSVFALSVPITSDVK